MTNLTAKIAKIKFGTIEVEGLMVSDGSFGIAIPQLCDLFADEKTFKTSKNTAARDFKRLMGEGFKTSKCFTEFNRGTTLSVDLFEFERILRKLDRLSNRYFKTDTNNASIYLKRLMGKDFKTDKVKTEFNRNVTLSVNLLGFVDDKC
jgi:hypothetical protein